MNYTGHLQIYTYKKGLLSRVAHDLRLKLASCEVTLSENQVTGQFALGALQLEGALINGQIAPHLLDQKDKTKILHNVHNKVLRSHDHPEVKLTGTISGSLLSGQLHLCGRLAPVSCPLEKTESSVSGQIDLRPSDWGISPFKALLGAIQLQDRVLVAFNFTTEPTSQ